MAGSGYEKKTEAPQTATKTSTAQAKAAFLAGETDLDKIQEIGNIRSYQNALRLVDEWSEELHNSILEHRSEIAAPVVPESERKIHGETMASMEASLESIRTDLEAIESQEASLTTILDRLANHPEFDEVEFSAAIRAVKLAGDMADRRSKLLKDQQSLYKTWKAQTTLDIESDATRASWRQYRLTQAKLVADSKAQLAKQVDKPKKTNGLDI